MTQILSSFSTKLLTLTLLISLVPIIFFGSLMFTDKINKELDSIKNDLVFLSKDKADHVTEWIEQKETNVKDIANNLIVVSEVKKILEKKSEQELFDAKISLEKQLNVAHQNHHWLKELRISEPQTGEVLFYTGLTSPKYNLKYQNHFLEAAKGNTAASDIYPSLEIIENEFGSFERGVPTLLISSPIEAEVGIQAILTARVDVFDVMTHLNKEDNFDNYASIDSYLVNSNGFLLSKPKSFTKLWNQNLIDTRPELELSLNDLFPTNPLEKSLNSKYEIGWNEGYDNFLGEKVVGIAVPVKGTQWQYLTEINHSEAFYEVNFFQALLLTLIGVTMLGVSMLSLFYSSKLTNPIRALISVIEQIKKGNLKVNVKTCGTDELGDLAVAFNSMAKSLQKSKETKQAILKKYHDLYENSPLLHRTINMKGIVTNCNKVYAETFGYKKSEIIGKSIFEFVPLEHRELLESSFADWKRTGVVNNREIIFRKKNGDLFQGLLSATNLYSEKGNRIGSNTIIVDVTDVRKKEKEIEDLKQKRLSTIGELTARIAHDMRNPLSVIKNTADLIKMEQLHMDEKSLKNWERLERGIFRIKHQVEDVLDYVKNTPFKKKPNYLKTILQDSIERVEVPNNISIKIPTKKVLILCDGEKIETVFVNLLLNAIQALEDKPGRIEISIKEETSDYVKIQLEDSGPGIPSHLLPKIFDPLFTTRQIGTGLGLPSCKNIIENHGGSLEVSSPQGKGAIFEIILPKRSEWDLLTDEGSKQSILKK